MTGDDHNTDALIAALRSPALPAERAGEAAAVTAMFGAIARIPAPTRFRAGRGIAIAVVTVASLGVGGLAAAGPGVFQAAAGKARSLVTDSATGASENAGAENGGDPLSGSLLNNTIAAELPAVMVHTQTLTPATEQTVAGVDCSAAQCSVGSTAAGALTPTAPSPPPECADGNHGDAVSTVASGSVPPNAEHSDAVNDVAHDTCRPQDPQGNATSREANPNKPEVTPAGPPISTPAGEQPTPPVTGPPVAAPPVSTPPNPPIGPPISTPGQGNGLGSDDGQGANNSQGQSNPPPVSIPPDSGVGVGRGNGG